MAIAFLCLISYSAAFAQEAKTIKSGSAKEAKVKILQKENGEYMLLDTTLTLAEGVSVEAAVKQLKLQEQDLKALGAKPFVPSEIKGVGDIDFIRVLPSKVTDSARAVMFRSIRPDSARAVLFRNLGSDSARTVLFKTFGADSVKAVKWRSSVPDSLFSKIRDRHFYVKGAAVEGMSPLENKAININGQQLMLRHSIGKDSLMRMKVFFRLDSTVQLKADSFLIRDKIKIEKDGQTGEIKIFRMHTDGTSDALETGEYDVLKLNSDTKEKVIVLRASKTTEVKNEKKEGEKAKKKEKANASQLDVKVYPNPTSGTVNLSFDVKKKANVKVRIVDSQGRTVLQDERESFQGQYAKEINLSKYGAGVFVIQLMIGNSIQAEKVLVQ
ncbi:T9SS type A sorting domain-containing protein [Rufibacter roseus]|uniref:T9SS type A sorting domain-containing protein n=2 Tax=Rufibacter roseus TaxID=1567108 RepID=A0ABW2DNX6_9BACT